jgi:hypothetical protein
LHVADRNTLQVHRLPLTNALGIIKVCNESDFLGEKAAGPADQEDENGQG